MTTSQPEVVEKPRHWRTLDERDETPAARLAAHDEFVVGAVDPAVPRDTFVSRRDFMGLVAAASALVGTAACSKRKKGTIVPYTKRPQEVVPGVATYYASTFPEGPRAYPVLVKTREGRPIHIQGNDEHPTLKGKTSPRALADVLRLYDPDRLRAPKAKGTELSWKDAESRLLVAFSGAKASQKPVLLLTGALASPTTRSLVADLQKVLPTLEHLAWEPAAGDAAQAAALASYGKPVQVVPHIDKAQVVLSLGADFLNGEDPEAIRTFAAKRRLEKAKDGHAMNRLWVVEGAMSLTGQNADQRLTVRPSRLAQVAFALAKELAPGHPELGGASLPADLHIPAATWKQLVSDLKHAGTEALVLCGEAMPVEAHRAAHLLNQILGSKAVDLLPAQPLASHQQLEAVAQKMKTGAYAAVLLWGVNPLYAHPKADLWQEALAKTPFKAWLGLMEDETSARCDLSLPESHWLEAWGDFVHGPACVLQQPTIAPLYDSRQGEEVLLGLIRGLGGSVPAEYHQVIQARWQKDIQPSGSIASFERFWQAALHDGLVRKDMASPAPAFSVAGLREAVAKAGSTSGFELVLAASPQVLDGRYGNNGWLQELPDPVTKTAWGNPLAVSVADAKALALKDGDQVKLTAGDRSVLLPVIVQPGQAKGVLSLALGYGRAVGGVSKGIGTNAFPLLGLDPASANVRTGVTLTPTGRRVEVPRTQSHHRMEGRDLVRSWSLDEFAHHEAHPHKPHILHTLYPEMQFPEQKWGMVIDLSSCVGCSGCVLACGSENNVPVVGPEQVAKGREMHWLRIDRYYEGDVENPKAVHQPMLCQHCDHAPCENVCPVNATNHSPDGLNQMAYNRCVGTRYCANNCPYKVRRFNFFEYTATKTEPESLVYNPEVTVRPRGVMEKCSFCVQRINDGRIRAKGENRPIRDGEIAPACAVSCPADAIVFGDLNDPKSMVSQLAKSGRQYKVLEELGARPAVTYLANLRNPGGEEKHHG